MTTIGPWARAAIKYVDARSSGMPLDRSLRITFNFHVDHESGGVTILDSLAEGYYRSQFETGTSNGGLTAHRGGARWQWERELFAGAYDDAPPQERPKYGALNHRHRTLGGAPRFGSAHVRLREHMLDRATYCFPDSAFAPTHLATAHRFDLLPLAEAHDEALRIDPLDDDRDPLDGYIEAQVHGQVNLREDAEALVLDPCYRETLHEEKAGRLGLPIEWHEGRVLHVATLSEHIDYRGPEPARIGREIAQGGVIDARIIGQAVLTGRYEAQPLKQLWHLTAQWGSPRGVA